MIYLVDLDIADETIAADEVFKERYGQEAKLTFGEVKEDISFVLETAISGDYRKTTTVNEIIYWTDIAWRRYLDKISVPNMSYSQYKDTYPSSRAEVYLKSLIYHVLLKIYQLGILSKFDWVALELEQHRSHVVPWAISQSINEFYYRIKVRQTTIQASLQTPVLLSDMLAERKQHKAMIMDKEDKHVPTDKYVQWLGSTRFKPRLIIPQNYQNQK